MLRRLYGFGFCIACLSVANLSLAASSARDTTAAARRNVSAQPEPTPTSKKSREAALPRQSGVVVIDAGHGGFDRGGISGQRIAESTMTLDVAQRLKAILQANGYRVVMTRESDVFVPLGTRVAIANSYRNAIFVCVHFNATRRSGASGIETYFYNRDSLTLASAIHYYVAGGAPSSNRGVRRRGYFVLRRTRIPAVLVECGFLTNPTEARYVQNSSYRQKLAEEIAHGVRDRSNVRTAQVGSNIPIVPLQPFIDQTRVRDRDISRSKRSSKKSKRTSSKSKKAKAASDDSATSKPSTEKKTEN